MKQGTLPILTYHAIDTTGAVTSTEPSRFADTIDTLLDAGFHAVDLARWIEAGRPPVEKGFALAFDDGLRSILNVADRIARLEIPATVFLVADRIGLDNGWPGQPPTVPRERLLDRSEIHRLSHMGVRFGSHGSSHLRFDRLNSQSLEREMLGSRERVEDLTGTACSLLAYPYGLSNRTVRHAAARSYEAAFGTRLDYASSFDNQFNIARIDAYYLKSRPALDRLVAGTWHQRLAVRRTFRAVRATVARVGLR